MLPSLTFNSGNIGEMIGQMIILFLLVELSQAAQEYSLKFELGFSPLGLMENWNQEGRSDLKKVLNNLMRLNLCGLNILFDDMPAKRADMANIQAEIVDFIGAAVDLPSMTMCPSYYSFDPILEEVFGKMPEDYLQDIGELISQNVGLFWTGDKVISESYSDESINNVEKLLKRRPVLWDNSLANDGKKTSPYLKFHHMAITEKSLPSDLPSIYFNPMNQAAVFEQVINSFFISEDEIKELKTFERFLDVPVESFKQLLFQFESILSECSVDQLDKDTKDDMLNFFEAYKHEPLAINITDWLGGRYEFDPNLLKRSF